MSGAAAASASSSPTSHTLRVVDHDQAWSVYFCDPYGNRYEVTTYDYTTVAAALARESSAA